MLLRLLDTLARDPGAFLELVPILLVTVVLALLIAITVHEFSHALAAHYLGDDTARRQGRLSLNPLVHLDPLGTLMLFIVGLGWGKPVPVDPYRLRGGRSGMARVALAGPASNIVVASLVALPVKAGLLAWHSPLRYAPLAQMQLDWVLADILGYVIFFNILLAIFNLIPVFPLDGFNIAAGLLPGGLRLSRLAMLGPAVLLLVIVSDNFLGTGILWGLLGPPADLLGRLLVGHPLF